MVGLERAACSGRPYYAAEDAIKQKRDGQVPWMTF